MSSEPRIDWQQREKEEVQAAVRALSDIANRSHSRVLFVEYMAQEHRTLQQSMTGLMLFWMQYLSTLNENQCDLRNEAAVKISKIYMKAIDDAGLIPHLPFI